MINGHKTKDGDDVDSNEYHKYTMHASVIHLATLCTPRMLLLHLITVTAVVPEASTLREGEEVLDAEQVGGAISQMIKTHVPLCSIIFLGTQSSSPIISTVRR